MGSQDIGAVLQSVDTLFRVGTVTGLADGELLERFVDRPGDGAEVAFAALVQRHGPMVLRVCQGELQDLHAAEDAFQATFLILARKAGSIRKRASMASWLFGVARRVARRARVERTRRIAHERRGASMAMAANSQRQWDHQGPDLVPEIQEEVDRLPEKYREPIVLCYLEGLTHEQAARELRVPVGTVKVRLARGRERLRGRLVRRGLAPSLIASFFTTQVQGAIPTPLLEFTVKAAMQVAAVRAAGVSATVSALVEGVLRAMFLAHLRSMAALVATSLTLLLASALILATLSQPARSGSSLVPGKVGQDVVALKKLDGQPGELVTETLKKSSFQSTTMQPGTVAAFDTVDVYSRVPGLLKSVKVDIGDAVKRGQLLAEIDAPELLADYHRGRAVVERARAGVIKARSGIKIAEADWRVEQAKANSARAELQSAEASLQYRQKTVGRMKNLLARKAIEAGLLEEETNRLQTAEASRSAAQAGVIAAAASLDGTQAKLEGAKGDVVAAEANLKVADADLEKAQILAQHTAIVSPLDGIVTRRGRNAGDFVRSPSQGETTPLFTIVKIDTVRVMVGVPDHDAPLVDVGDRAIVQLDALAGRQYEGKVARTAVAYDTKDQTLRTEIDLPNPDGRLRPGQFGRVTITLEEKRDVLRIPESSLVHPSHTEGSRLSCYRVVDGRAVKTPIKILDTHSGVGVVYVVDGLKEGDTIVVNPKKLPNLDERVIPLRTEQRSGRVP
jgi:RND family efflux transporter MFP subunit